MILYMVDQYVYITYYILNMCNENTKTCLLLTFGWALLGNATFGSIWKEIC